MIKNMSEIKILKQNFKSKQVICFNCKRGRLVCITNRIYECTICSGSFQVKVKK